MTRLARQPAVRPATSPGGARTFTLRLDRPAVSFRVGRGSLLLVLLAMLGTLTLLAVGAGSGAYPIAPGEVITALLGGADPDASYVVWSLRLPRLLTAVLVGAALALSGAIFQALARNPLVSPDVIGISGGAALAAVAVIVLGVSRELVGPAAFAGGLVAALVVYLASWSGGIDRTRLVLIGVGVAAFAQAGIAFLFARSELLEVMTAQAWLVGSLYASSWRDVLLLGVSLAVLAPLALGLSRGLLALQLGDDAAAGLGLATERTRLALIVTAVALTTVSVAAAGPIAFVAFIAPHIARRLARTTGSGLLPASAAVGALLVVGADLVARRVLEPVELPVGIVTVLMGGPFFLWLLVRGSAVRSAA
jgi:iron complex transport system permease protein